MLPLEQAHWEGSGSLGELGGGACCPQTPPSIMLVAAVLADICAARAWLCCEQPQAAGQGGHPALGRASSGGGGSVSRGQDLP